MSTGISVSAENAVDFPTFGLPTRPMRMLSNPATNNWRMDYVVLRAQLGFPVSRNLTRELPLYPAFPLSERVFF